MMGIKRLLFPCSVEYMAVIRRKRYDGLACSLYHTATGKQNGIAHTPPYSGVVFTKHVRGCRRMDSYIEDRVLAVADYIIDHQATVRAAAGAFKISKSTVYGSNKIGRHLWCVK